METGFNIVDVPGSKSRKVAEKKQHWYRTAIWKTSHLDSKYLINSLFCNFIGGNFTQFVRFAFSDNLSYLSSYFCLNLFSVPETALPLILKLQKTIRITLPGCVSLLVKSNFDFSNRIIDCVTADRCYGVGNDQFKKQIKWRSI